MSTYYYFACDECHEYGGWLSRQAWGWGNMDIVDSFAFLANHIASCGQKNLRIVDEHEASVLDNRGWIQIASPDENELGPNERPAAYPLLTFPHSNDWQRHEELFAAYGERVRQLRSENSNDQGDRP